jgi:hypothetical protein
MTSSGSHRVIAYALLLCALASTLVPLLPAAEELPVRKHHLVHGLVLALSAAAGYLFARERQARQPHQELQGEGWLYFTVLMPVLSMFLMWPTTYDWLEHHPLAHGGEHLCFVVLGFMATYSGERYMPGVGVMSGVATVLSAIVAAFGFGSGLSV